MPSRRPALALLPALALGLTLPLAPPAGAEEGPGETPAPRAVTADGKPAEISDVLEYCEAKAHACRFVIDPKLGREFVTTIRSLGNAVVNCTNGPMSVDRTVTLRTSSTDNIGGEISGKITAEGTVSASGEVTTNLTNDNTSEHKTPNLKDGPTSTNGTKTSVAAGGKVAGSMTAKLAFEAAFKATYSKSWTVDNTETTTYKTTVSSGDMLVFGANAAMRRVVGSLVAGSGASITGIVVDSPSMITSSTFVAQTYSAPANVCGAVRPPGNGATGNNPQPGPPSTPRGLRTARTPDTVAPGAVPKRVDVLRPTRTAS
ncbi:hypothetical protein AB0G79_26090 [Streptomyces sp. NPDC020807]|uniref:hypothetical protein n=1 Tax=Streptomyces sp. NPDC020807 TaxID=3155119 RepID=UPI0033C6351D